MPFKFNEKKTIQAVGFLLKQTGDDRKDNYMRLLKLLYIADKESLLETGHPITGDRVVAMDRGPVLSHVYNLIKGEAYDCSLWDEHFTKQRYHLCLKKDPSNGELNLYEMDKLIEISERYSNDDEKDMVDITHTFEEWQKNYVPKTSRPISLEDILIAVGRGDDINAIYERAEESEAISNFFGG